MPRDESIEKYRFTLIIDFSNSMNESLSNDNPKKKIDVAKLTVEKIAKEINTQTKGKAQFKIIIFPDTTTGKDEDEETGYVEFKDVPIKKCFPLYKFGKFSHEFLKKRADGYTPLLHTIYASLDPDDSMWADDYNERIWVLTDGGETIQYSLKAFRDRSGIPIVDVNDIYPKLTQRIISCWHKTQTHNKKTPRIHIAYPSSHSSSYLQINNMAQQLRNNGIILSTGDFEDIDEIYNFMKIDIESEFILQIFSRKLHVTDSQSRRSRLSSTSLGKEMKKSFERVDFSNVSSLTNEIKRLKKKGDDITFILRVLWGTIAELIQKDPSFKLPIETLIKNMIRMLTTEEVVDSPTTISTQDLANNYYRVFDAISTLEEKYAGHFFVDGNLRSLLYISKTITTEVRR